MKKMYFFISALASLPLCTAALAEVDLSDITSKAQKGDAQAQYELGMIYFKGDGLEKDSAKALRWYQLAAAQGHEGAKLILKILTDLGLSTDPSTPSAASSFPEPSSAETEYQAGLRYYYGDGLPINLEKAAKCFYAAAIKGHAAAQGYLAVCYKNGEGVIKDDEKSFSWAKLGAEQGDARAQYALGVFCYMNELGPNGSKSLSHPYSEAVKWYKLSAEQGFAAAQCSLGLCYENGEGVEPSISEAVKWYKLSAEQGFPPAQCALGTCYVNGKGVGQNHTEAVRLFKLAADHGYEIAQFRLGICYYNGWGVEKNLEEAIRWFKKAAENGWGEAIEALRELGVKS